MTSNKALSILAVLASAAAVSAHGHVSNIIINGVYYRNFDPTSDPYNSNPPAMAGWTADQLDNGFVAPDAYNAPDMICHRKATPGKAHIRVAAGDSITIKWSEWPESHKGPVMDWLANCNGPCETVDKLALRFFKIDGAGIINQGNPGYYAADDLIKHGNSWLVRIPSNVAPGNYVLRHEILALHGAGSLNGAQSYPQCINLEITGSGTYNPPGTAGTALYASTDPGVLVNIYTSSVNYIVPGGAPISGGVSSVSQFSSVATATASPTVGTGGSGGGGGGAASTTLRTSTGAPPATTPPPSGGATQTVWGQCGGSGWTGPTACPASANCASLNPYYSQCTPR